jgi:hypothetical protein
MYNRFISIAGLDSRESLEEQEVVSQPPETKLAIDN